MSATRCLPHYPMEHHTSTLQCPDQTTCGQLIFCCLTSTTCVGHTQLPPLTVGHWFKCNLSHAATSVHHYRICPRTGVMACVLHWEYKCCTDVNRMLRRWWLDITSLHSLTHSMQYNEDESAINKYVYIHMHGFICNVMLIWK